MDVEALNEAVDDCQDNSRYGEAGIACMKEFTSLVQAKSEVLRKAMKSIESAAIDRAGNSQANNLLGTQSDYEATLKTLAELIRAGHQAKEYIEGYLTNIVFPEDFDAPEEAIGDPLQYLDNSSCYAGNRDGLENILDDLDDKLEELEETRKETQKLGSRTSTHKADMNSVQGSQAAHAPETPKARPNAAPKAGHHPRRENTITGVEEDREKQKKSR